MDVEPTLAEFENHMVNVLKIASDEEYQETLALLEHIRAFRKDYQSVKEFLK